jgi:F0F1-type ATP synthase assembly protein I
LTERPEARSRLATGIQMASSITSIGLEFSIPVGIGIVIDRRWHTAPIATLIGAALGFLAGFMHILTVAKRLATVSKKGREPNQQTRAADRPGSR